MRFWPKLQPHAIGRARRCVLAVLGVAGAATILRPQISSALVVRGDEMLYMARTARALVLYHRALFFDPDNAAAADRYVFVSMTTHRRTALEDAVVLATSFLRRHNGNATILMDRALCNRSLGRQRAAELDFVRADMERKNAAALVFAGYAALRLGDPSRARHWWRMSLNEHPDYTPAEKALRRR